MVDSNKQLRVANKGASIRKAGFLSGIHALPVGVKAKLDELLLLRYSPEKVLSILEKECLKYQFTQQINSLFL